MTRRHKEIQAVEQLPGGNGHEELQLVLQHGSAGDFNSWRKNRAGDEPREYLMRQGFDDTAAAATRINIKYPTINHFKTAMPAKGVRLDVVLIKGMKRALRYENA